MRGPSRLPERAQASPFSRRDFCSRASPLSHHVANGFPACAISWVSLCPPRPQTKGKRNAERRVVTTRALRARGALLRSALASRRPTAALARETAGPQGSAPGHASGDSPERSILWTANRGEDRAHLHGSYPRRKNQRNHCPRTVSTSRAGHDAGRLMPDAARERVTNPPAGTALAPSQGVSSRRTSFRKARWSLLVCLLAGIQEIPPAGAIPLI